MIKGVPIFKVTLTICVLDRSVIVVVVMVLVDMLCEEEGGSQYSA